MLMQQACMPVMDPFECRLGVGGGCWWDSCFFNLAPGWLATGNAQHLLGS